MKTQAIVIQGKGYKLSGTLVIPDKITNKLPSVIFYHGMVSQSKPRYVKRAEALTEYGIASLVFDFRGCGESDGKLGELSLSDWFEDALLAYDFLLKQSFVDPKRVGISGKSFGGYMAVLVSKERGIASMVLHAPAVYDDAWFNSFPYKPSNDNDEYARQRRIYRNSKNAFSNKAMKAIKVYSHPLLVVGSELDDICPKNVVEGYYNLCQSKNKRIEWIKGADHPLIKEEWNQQYFLLMADWFKKTLF